MAEKVRTISESESEAGGAIMLDTTSASDIMNSSQISNMSSDSIMLSKNTYNIAHNVGGKASCRFPKLEECAHFHYERVQLGKISMRLVDEKIDDTASQTKSFSGGNTGWFIVRVSAGRSETFLIRRSLDNFKMLDELLHQCVYDRKFSALDDLKELDVGNSQIESIISKYLTRFSMVASDAMTCGPVLTWLQLDNKGRRLPVADMDTMRTINTPAVGAAYGVKRYTAQACDEISIEVGDMISVIDMPSPAESVWWRGKKSHLQKSQYEVGFFPQSCVATIGDKVPRHMPLPAPLVGSLAVSPTKPVLRKHGKLIAFFRSFILARPSRRRLKQSGIYKERVFSCDLSEHLLNSGSEIPMVLKCCAEFIEEYGIVDGIYRLSGITSNIQKLRRAFDEERIPDLSHPEIRQDIHAVSSLLKMYFRELPNPLCTYQLYDNFVDAIQNRADGEEFRLKCMKETVQKLPPPHYRTLKYLSTHLNKISRYSDNTGMTDRNLAIVWAPNLLRSPALESGGVAALRGVGVQAVVTEYLITNCEHIFSSDEDFTRFPDPQFDSLTDSDSFVEQRDHDLSFERPKSLNVGGAKLLSLEEAQLRANRSENIDMNKTIQLNTSALQGGYIEVGGGPQSLPDKYHTVLPVPRSWQKRKTHSWKSIFSRGGGQSRQVGPGTNVKLSQGIQDSRKDEKIKNSKTCEEKECHKIPISISQGKISGNNSTTTLNVCVRSNSIDSLRTAGHSRSVSHDSYFDLLQSPLRAALGLDNSREMSELGLNFDREEPEMRIFSESESLVSSPKVTKDSAQQPPATRKVLRARPEEYSSTANSVNPSPKKQPRLNLTSPGSEITSWLDQSSNQNEGSCKRYKLEDQLSDIQYIDCCTPEHTIGVNQTAVQIHNRPPSSVTASHEALNVNSTDCSYSIERNEKVPTRNPSSVSRYSFPGKSSSATVQTRNYHEANKDVMMKKEGRFSYPVTKEEKFGMGKFFHTAAGNDVNKFSGCVDVGGKIGKRYETAETENRKSFSFFEPAQMAVNEAKNDVIVLRTSSSHDAANLSNSKSTSTINRSKLSIATPQSPGQSPRYSLLVGDNTSSEASTSSQNTPTYDNSRNSFENQTKDLCRRKNEMSLDLKVESTATHSTTSASHTSDNTSQSMTPSEFGYQNLNRTQSGLVTPDNSPKSTTSDHLIYDPIFYENSGMKVVPMKATISITYKSPTKTKSESSIISDDVYEDIATPCDDESVLGKKSLLETTFDDKMVYEQVKFFKSTVCEVNEMLEGGTDKNNGGIPENDHVVPEMVMSDDENKEVEVVPNVEIGDDKEECDVVMSSVPDDENDVTKDSLEYDLSMYENVHVKASPKVYENVELCGKPKKSEKTSPSNFTVRQLATKFESSPVENLPPFDFNNKPNGRKSDQNRNSPCPIRNTNVSRNSDKKMKITRSLDENAFVREFGAKQMANINLSIQQIHDYENELSESRRKSLDITSRPKSLNPPKKLPNITNENDEICKTLDRDSKKSTKDTALRLDFTKIERPKPPTIENVKITPTTENRISLIQHNIFVAANNQPQTPPIDDGDSKSSNSNLSTKAMENVKLDRERIEKIKEERRLQLNEKFRSESFRGGDKTALKSKSKTELRDLKNDNRDQMTSSSNSDHRTFLSKSRNDVRNIIENNQDVTNNYFSRVRRVSDEKNQNDVVVETGTPVMATSTKKLRETTNTTATQKKNLMEANQFEDDGKRASNVPIKCSQVTQRDKISPQRSIKDVAAMFESKLQNQ